MVPSFFTGSSGNRRDWNGGKHRRIFLRSSGRCIRRDRGEQVGELVFWAEWEAERLYPVLAAGLGSTSTVPTIAGMTQEMPSDPP